MFNIIKDLFKYDGRFRFSLITLLCIVFFALLSFWSPYDPSSSYYVPSNIPPGAKYLFGTNSRGQDIFWMMTFAIKNSLVFGIITALLSRILAIFVGLISGYKGGIIDRVLMSINDSFIVLPLLPILILLKFIIGKMELSTLALVMAVFGWSWDARLIRSQVLSLRERDFTYTSVFSGMGTLKIALKEYFPFIIPIVLATTVNNMLWSLGMEMTLAILGLSAIHISTIGTTIYWANQHQALISGVWWWLAFPIIISIFLFLALYLLSVSLSEYLDPRFRIQQTRV